MGNYKTVKVKAIPSKKGTNSRKELTVGVTSQIIDMILVPKPITSDNSTRFLAYSNDEGLFWTTG